MHGWAARQAPACLPAFCHCAALPAFASLPACRTTARRSACCSACPPRMCGLRCWSGWKAWMLRALPPAERCWVPLQQRPLPQPRRWRPSSRQQKRRNRGRGNRRRARRQRRRRRVGGAAGDRRRHALAATSSVLPLLRCRTARRQRRKKRSLPGAQARGWGQGERGIRRHGSIAAEMSVLCAHTCTRAGFLVRRDTPSPCMPVSILSCCSDEAASSDECESPPKRRQRAVGTGRVGGW